MPESVVPTVLLGNQQPGLLHLPDGSEEHVDDALDLLGEWGFGYDVSQMFVISSALRERPDGRWSAKEIGVEEPRQNGKGEIIEGRECLGLFYLDERKLIHSAHEFATASEALDRIEDRIGANPQLKRQVRTIKRSHGEEGVYLKDGRKLLYKTRTKGGGRGFSADLLILDEAMYVAEAFLGALMPVISARPNPQMWYTGSAVNQATMPNGVVFAKLRERALEHRPGRMAYFGFSAAYVNNEVIWKNPSEVPREEACKPETVARANPALGPREDGGRIDLEHVLDSEWSAMSHDTFCVERLGVGDWPDTSEDADRKIGRDQWKACLDSHSRRTGPVVFAFAVSEDRQTACISAAGPREDGEWHVERIDHRPGQGTDWVVDRLKDLSKTHRPVAVLWRKDDPANSLAEEIETAKIRRRRAVTAGEFAQACGVFYDSIERVDPDTGDKRRGTLHHIGQPELTAAVDGAATKPYGDGGWVWRQMASDADITPLVSGTLALWLTVSRKGKRAGVVDLAAALAAAEQS